MFSQKRNHKQHENLMRRIDALYNYLGLEYYEKGYMDNGKMERVIVSKAIPVKSNLTISLKPNSKSKKSPVYCNIGGVIKKVKLSKNFKNAGTNVYKKKKVIK